MFLGQRELTCVSELPRERCRWAGRRKCGDSRWISPPTFFGQASNKSGQNFRTHEFERTLHRNEIISRSNQILLLYLSLKSSPQPQTRANFNSERNSSVFSEHKFQFSNTERDPMSAQHRTKTAQRQNVLVGGKIAQNFQLPQKCCQIDFENLAYLPKTEQRLIKDSGILICGISTCTNIFIKSSTEYRLLHGLAWS